MSDYTELHLHDQFSALDGLNTAAEYMVRAKELGMTHLAQTNHGTLAGHRNFQIAAKDAGIVPILGLESYISPTDRFDRRTKQSRQDGTSIYNHIILLAQDEQGLESLNRISTEAWKTGFYHKPRIDRELLFSDNEGIIALSGCLNGLISKALEAGDMDRAMSIAQEFKDAMGDRFYIEVQGHNPFEINDGLLLVADTLGIKAVATSDCHYARKEDLWVEDAMLILSTNPKPNRQFDMTKAKKMNLVERYNYLYPDRMMTFQEIEIYLRDRLSNIELFEKQGITRTDIYDNTVEIAQRIGSYPFYEGLDLLPKPPTENPDDMLTRKVYAGLRERGLFDKPEYIDRANEELAVIKDKNFSTYFLIVSNIVSWAKNQKIRVGPGRGSGAGSLVNYALKITEVDPIKYNLLFFRFINPERNDFPDIDVDFADKDRGRVKERTRERFTHVASIATYTTFAGKVAVRDAARVFMIPKAEVNKALKNIEFDDLDVFEMSEQGRAFCQKHPEVLKLARALHGRIRGNGMHASGVVVSKEPINKFAPIETAKDPNNQDGPRIDMVAQDMNEAADIGLIKLDWLGLKALTVVDDTLAFIEERRDRKIDPLDIPLDDDDVYAMLSAGYTKGVFQCEAVPYTNLIIKMGGIHNFDELAASNALVRPGAMNTIGAEYIARKNGESMVTYPHVDMKWFTDDTYGEILYQEQVMLTMTELAGMKMTTADKVRKIIGKKLDVSEFAPYKAEFIAGASKKISEKKAEKLWSDFEAHAGYSFNKSHAVAYSMVSYWTAWLKHHFPLEFMAATLKNEKDKDAITDYLIETKRLGLKVILPHVNSSEKGISIEKTGIRLGLTNIKFIADRGAENIIKHRPYRDYKHLLEVSQTKGSGVTSRIVASLNAVGGAKFADNPLYGNERDNFYEYLGIPSFGNLSIEPVVQSKFIEFDEYDENGVYCVFGMVRKIKHGDGWARVELVDETGSAGIFVNPDTLIESGQIYAILAANNRVFKYMTLEEIAERLPGGFTDYLYEYFPDVPEGCVKVVSTVRYTTKKGAKMAYTVVQKPNGTLVHAMVFPQQFRDNYIKVREGSVVKVELAETDSGSIYIKEFK